MDVLNPIVLTALEKFRGIIDSIPMEDAQALILTSQQIWGRDHRAAIAPLSAFIPEITTWDADCQHQFIVNVIDFYKDITVIFEG